MQMTPLENSHSCTTLYWNLLKHTPLEPVFCHTSLRAASTMQKPQPTCGCPGTPLKWNYRNLPKRRACYRSAAHQQKEKPWQPQTQTRSKCYAFRKIWRRPSPKYYARCTNIAELTPRWHKISLACHTTKGPMQCHFSGTLHREVLWPQR